MANFRYQIIDSKGKMSEGIVEAATIGEASRKLKQDGNTLLPCHWIRAEDLPIWRSEALNLRLKIS